MHQEHTIPLNQLASNFKFIRHNVHVTPHSAGLFPRRLSTQIADLNHFTRMFSKTITAFSEAERKKYRAKFEVPAFGMLYSDAFRFRQCAYYTGDASLADVVKILINENEIPALFILAQHPKIPLHPPQLRTLFWVFSRR